MCDNPIYCELCGDCIVCFGEDPCYFADDGKHVEPTLEQTKTMIYDLSDPIDLKFIDAAMEAFAGEKIVNLNGRDCILTAVLREPHGKHLHLTMIGKEVHSGTGTD